MSETSHYQKETESTQPVITITANNNDKSQDRAEKVAVPTVSTIYYLTYPVSNKNLRHTKKQGSMTQISRKKKRKNRNCLSDFIFKRQSLQSIHYKYVQRKS